MNKNELRDFYKKIRNNISECEKIQFDKMIFTSFINSFFIKKYDNFLIYVSVNNEVETANLIQFLLDNNKKVSVPNCQNRNMCFYSINSLDELTVGAFGIPSADISVCKKCENFDNTLCIVPAVSFDNNGNRLGYGGGYYDRFLSENKLPTIGLCYERCICELIPNESFDIKIDYVLTEQHLRNHITKEVPTYG